MFPKVSLTTVTREDVQRVDEWLNDPEVNSSWYGLGEGGEPLHIGYSPREFLQATEEEWRQNFENEDRRIYSVYTNEGDHIGEGQLVIEWSLLEAQLFLLIGRKEMWHHHYGTSALIGLLDHAFGPLGLHRVWVDVSEYNEPGLQMVQHVGFVLEGRLRKSHRKNNEWFDSTVLGLLADEYPRRRAKLLETAIN